MQICALRPAPVQVTYLGFPGSSGADFFDYTIVDKTLVPKNNAKYYSEKLIYMPHSFQINSSRAISKNEYSRNSFGLPDKSFVFASFNGPLKINKETFECWMEILHNVPNSVLWLFKYGEFAEKNLRNEAKKYNIDSSRLIFSGYLPLEDHLKRHAFADLALDPFYYSGGATTSHALWMGLPVITLPGRTYISRMSASLLTNAGMVELIVKNKHEYVKLATDLATNPDRLMKIQRSLIENREYLPLFDTKRFVYDVEHAYKTIWKRYKSGLPPANVNI